MKNNNTDELCVPGDIEEAAKRATFELLPKKSAQQYDIAYSNFLSWCRIKKVEGNFSEPVFLAYLEEKSKIWNSSTLWSKFSMIKASVLVKNGVDVSKYFKVIAFLKRKNEGYSPKKSKTLTFEQVQRFINEAPDEKYLMVKVATIFGIYGACRREELCNLLTEDIELAGTSLIVQIPNTKTKISRSFCIIGKYVDYFSKYAALRPSVINHRRFFLKYSNYKCTANPVGINTFGKMPSTIAEFLNLPDTKAYTGHCFRRSSASLLAESGANITEIKKHGGWKSTSVAEGYLDQSITHKKAIAERIIPTPSSTITGASSTSHQDMIANGQEINKSVNSNLLQSSLNSQGINISNCSNCTIHINVHKL
uniref:Tyr recombinase domain-containing protein n=1 Tax=Photinus pyralis TaxID=7054 RepID=A0A1Y1M608_PHOPY